MTFGECEMWKRDGDSALPPMFTYIRLSSALVRIYNGTKAMSVRVCVRVVRACVGRLDMGSLAEEERFVVVVLQS